MPYNEVTRRGLDLCGDIGALARQIVLPLRGPLCVTGEVHPRIVSSPMTRGDASSGNSKAQPLRYHCLLLHHALALPLAMSIGWCAHHVCRCLFVFALPNHTGAHVQVCHAKR
eukprot:scaffold70391_cov39-Tisochrysis_lutea.AAC.2